MRYIGLLRAVNVGGKNKMKMAELRNALESIDLQNVQTYIQSGNIIFDSEHTQDVLQQRIEHHLEQHFGFHTDLILRTATEFDRLVADCPFIEQAEAVTSSESPAGLYVALLNESPSKEAVEALARYVSADEQYRLVGRDLYLLLSGGMAQSRLAPRVQKLGTAATLRNWKTIRKLHTLASHS